jgi:hypothetical protein
MLVVGRVSEAVAGEAIRSLALLRQVTQALTKELNA